MGVRPSVFRYRSAKVRTVGEIKVQLTDVTNELMRFEFEVFKVLHLQLFLLGSNLRKINAAPN